MRDKAFGVLQRVGRSFMLPIAILPVAGLLLGVGQSFTNRTMLRAYGLEKLLGEGTVWHAVFTVMSQAGNIVFANLPILFAIGVAIGMAKREKEVAALSAVVAFLIMHASISALITLHGGADTLLEGAATDVVGILSLQMGVFGGIIVGLGVAALHNRFYKIELPQILSFFGGTRFVPIISAIVYTAVGILMYYVWPLIQRGIYSIGDLVLKSGYFGTWIYGVAERALIPFGLHHVFYLPFWQTAVGGTLEVAGKTVEGAQNIFFAQLADPAVEHFAVSATRFMSGKFPLMIFGLPGAALAMYQAARPEKKKAAAGLLLSAALTSMLTGITEPLEFTFLFVAPLLYVVHCVLAGLSYMLMHLLDVGVGMTFSGGLIDLFLFGILQGNAKTNWIRIVAVGIVYFFVYYGLFLAMIRKFNYLTPGREAEGGTKLYTRKDVEAREKRAAASRTGMPDGVEDPYGGFALTAEERMSLEICLGLGGRQNLSDLDCCATRLRCTVRDGSLVDEARLKATGASGIIRKGDGVQIIYGPRVSVIKSHLEDYLEQVPPETERMAAEREQADAAFGEDPARNGSSGRENPGRAVGVGGDIAGNRPVDSEAPGGGGADGRYPGTPGAAAAEKPGIALASPMTGCVFPLEQVPDEAFSSGMLGDGVAIEPTEGVVTAPADGLVKFVFPARHAIGFETAEGRELLLHVGIDTVNLEGKGFEVFVKTGETVKKGQKLMEIDLAYVAAHAPSLVSPLLCTDLGAGHRIRVLKEGTVRRGEPLLEIREKAR